MELIILLCGAIPFICGTILMKRGRHGQFFLWLAVACFVVAIILSGLRILSGMNFAL